MGDFTNALVEELAALKHEQWATWAKEISEIEKISPERLERWKKFFVPYDQLPEEVKDSGRVWANKVLEVIVFEFEKYMQAREKKEE